ncbi:AcrB/AcrD/AcrF family protein [Sphingomicrobium astaxanthinifaciens]|uniref:AcrB/AcrD/AcrF family protein n=1 Tax=Sphingomicrobium astaxanthinifaciens TaxID=1227949 RepID=UPI001FCC9639|nr:AcrB/AcrD/AcrF family protein [Sphingomicrobium astaxanthinifaciens]MCJ7421301.1 AcrB/AcrD/AcrF family protein [Sphingomicrobium astaxanthinifaciens]
MLGRIRNWMERRWVVGTMIVWMLFTSIVTATNAVDIATLNLRDTDDNLRLLQVRDWLAGQGWYDLRQYRMLAPQGADIHWSRLVDLPLAGLIALTEPLIGVDAAERFAATVVPLLALLVAMLGIALVARRVAGPLGWAPAAVAIIFSTVAISAFMPLRIDHHGWQLACLAWVLAGATDPARRRGGVVAGLATATSMVIGLEMLVPLALVGAALVLGWVARAQEARRLGAYGAALAAGCAAGFLAFASSANRALLCDALTPVWLSDMLLAGAAALLLAWASPAGWRRRLLFAAAAGGAIAAFHALAFPHCLSRLEGVSPEVSALWLERVNEARGVQTHSPKIALVTLLPVVIGLLGYALGWRLGARDFEARRRLLLVGLAAIGAAAMLAWQIRAGAAAQLLAVPGAALAVTLLLPRTLGSGSPLVRIIGTYLVVTLGIGALAPIAAQYVPANDSEREDERINRALEARAADSGEGVLYCREARVLGLLNRLDPATVFVHIDLAPRLLVLTHHDTIVGPYHRSDVAIGHVLSVFDAPPAEDAAAARTVRAYGARYLMVCDEDRAGDPPEPGTGLNERLLRGEVPDWLDPVDAPFLEGLPLRLYAVR